MNVQQLCDYLNEIGIIDMNNIKHFLYISTYMMNKNESKKSILDIYKIALFSYIKKINENNNNLYFTCSNIINSFKRYTILKKYNSLFLFKKIIYLKIYERYKSFLISLYKKYPYHTNNYHQNKNKKKKSKAYSNNFYNEINNNKIKEGKNDNENTKENNDINMKNKNLDINDNNIITFKENNDEIKLNFVNYNNYKYIKELMPSKKIKKLDNDTCINQSNINFEKYFINKKLILCKKNHNYSSYIERVKSNKKELYSKNPYEISYSSLTLRKNKSETKLRIRKMIYEEKIRSNNFETIDPELRKKIKRRKRSKENEELNKKKEEDKKFNKLTEKEIDTKNWVDRLYRKDIISKKRNERKEKKEIINNLKKSPINWEHIYLETNDKIIKKSKEPKMNKSCSYFMPKRGRIYQNKNTIESENKEEKNIINKNNIENKTIEINKNNINIQTSINDNNKSVKISFELNSPNKNINENNPNMISISNNSNNAFEIKESELNSINSEKEENKKIEEKKEKDEIKDSNIFDENDNFNEDEYKEKMDKFNVSPLNIKSKGIQDILMRNNITNKDNDSNNKKEENPKKEKNDFNDLLCSSNNENNII